MLNIDFNLFEKNLLLTQQYCERQLVNNHKNHASILRSINPDFNGRKIFQFSFSKSAGTISSVFCTIWNADPFDTPNLIEELFTKQIEVKQSASGSADYSINFEGKILAFKIDESLVDGAAGIYTKGFLDDYNCPPIDTWFYLINHVNSRLLLAWVPIQFVSDVDNGISINPENCIDWFEVWFPTDVPKDALSKDEAQHPHLINRFFRFFNR